MPTKTDDKQNEHEASILADCWLEAAKDPAVRLWRNNVGTLPRPGGGLLRFGLCRGSSDLIGFKSITVTPEMVGRKLAVFVGAECKTRYAYPSKAQKGFIRVVKDAGGFAGVFRNLDNLLDIMELGHDAE